MNLFNKIILLVFLMTITTSCLKKTESITPIAETKTLAELQKESLMAIATQAGNSELSAAAKSTLEASTDPTIFYLNLKYNLTDIDVFQVVNMPNSFEQIGHSFLLSMVKLVLAVGGPQEINMNSFELAVPHLNLDLNIVKSIKIKKVFLQYNSSVDLSSDYAANFEFLDTLEVARVVDTNNIGRVDSLLLSYRSIHNRCLFKCIQFDIINDNILDLLSPAMPIKLQPSLSIKSIPDVTNIRLDGSIELQIGLKLPF
jgi:hypothetical protein